MKRWVFAGLAGAVALSGCAYSMGHGDRRLPEGYKLVAVPVFKNATHEVGAEVPFTNAMIRELERSQLAKVVEKSEAQVVLEGVIDRIQYTHTVQETGSGLIPSGTILNTQYQVVAAITLNLRRVSDGVLLWSQDFTGEKTYDAPKIGQAGINSANALYNHSARQESLATMAGNIMAEAHGRLTENF